MGTVRIEYVALSELKRWPRNPKDHDLGELRRSIARFGYVQPILVDESTGRIVAGHGRLDVLEQMKAEGRKPPERVLERKGEWLVPVIRGVAFNSDDEAQAYLLADNRLTEIGGWEDGTLTDVLNDLAEKDLLEGIGWDGNDVEDMMRFLESVQLVESDAAESEDIKCPKCGFEWRA